LQRFADKNKNQCYEINQGLKWRNLQNGGDGEKGKFVVVVVVVVWSLREF
jgi:hypothetical protein